MSDAMIIPIDATGEFRLPDEVMARRGWRAGSRLVVELVPGGLLLKSAPPDGDREDRSTECG